MTTDAQRDAADRIASEYSESVRIVPNVGPDSDLVVVACPGGRTVIVSPDGEPLADSVRNSVYDQAVIAGLRIRAGGIPSEEDRPLAEDQTPEIIDEQVRRACDAYNVGAPDPETYNRSRSDQRTDMRAALEAARLQPVVAVAEDPVREAATALVEAYSARVTGYIGDNWIASVRLKVDALRETLAKPAPPRLTEDERKAVVLELDLLMRQKKGERGRHWQRIESAREKLS